MHGPQLVALQNTTAIFQALMFMYYPSTTTYNNNIIICSAKEILLVKNSNLIQIKHGEILNNYFIGCISYLYLGTQRLGSKEA